jgi:hypothetical protein
MVEAHDCIGQWAFRFGDRPAKDDRWLHTTGTGGPEIGSGTMGDENGHEETQKAHTSYAVLPTNVMVGLISSFCQGYTPGDSTPGAIDSRTD